MSASDTGTADRASRAARRTLGPLMSAIVETPPTRAVALAPQTAVRA
jgi:hypothetical protein